MRSRSRLSPSTSWRLNDAARALGGQHLPVAVAGDALGADGEHVALDVEVDAVSGHAGQVELDDEPVALAPGVHRHHRGTVGGAEDLLGEAVEVTERVGGTQQHHMSSWFCAEGPFGSWIYIERYRFYILKA